MGELHYLPFTTTGIHQCLSTQPWIDNELVSSIHVLMQARGTLIFSNQGLCWHIASAASFCYSIPLWRQMENKWSRTGWGWWTCESIMYCLSPLLSVILRENWNNHRQTCLWSSLAVYSMQNQCDQCDAQSIQTNECKKNPASYQQQCNGTHIFVSKPITDRKGWQRCTTQGTVFWF